MIHKTLIIGAVAVAAVIGLGGLYLAIGESRICAAKGGQLVSRPNTNVGLTSEGQVVMTSAETKVCVNAAGHVLQ